MKIEDIPTDLRCEYKDECDCCGGTIIVLSQAQHNPEYDTVIYIRCDCGEYNEFILPVN